MNGKQEVAHFKTRLAETIAWCAVCGNVGDPEGSLRTALLHPGNRSIDSQENVHYHWPTEESRQMLTILAEHRARLLDGLGRSPASLPQDLAGGRLLVCEPEDSVWDGLSEDWSRGFFDVVDVPPWDTWIELFRVPASAGRQYERLGLLCWVPPAFVELASEGMSANCVACISWASDLADNYPFLRQLQQAGFLV